MVRKKLPITYNTAFDLATVHDNPVSFLILDKLFDNLTLVTDEPLKWLEDLGLNAQLDNLGLSNKRIKEGTKLRQKKFIDYVKEHPKRKYVLYSPLDPPYKVNPLVFLMNSPTIGHAYENKRYFRDEFDDLIRIPEYEIKYLNELDKAAAYRELKDEFGAFVMQDEDSAGSKGTYVIKSYEEYSDAIRSLKKYSSGRAVVVSKFVKGQAASIQVCVTKHGVFSSGVQKQLVDSKYLTNSSMHGSTRWCGGELGGDWPDIVQLQAQEIASVIGAELGSHGFKGIFGVDLIISPENVVYAIEINARLTGFSHLLSDLQIMQGKIPFMLLHILELANVPYEVTDFDALPAIGRYKKSLSYMIMINPLREPLKMPKYIQPGVYRLVGDKLVFEKSAYSIDQLKGEDTVLIFSRHNQGDMIEPGKRIMHITRLGKSIAKTDLNSKNRHLVEVIKKQFGLPDTETK